MGRLPKNYKENILRENQELANEYMEYIGTVYMEYVDFFNNIFGEFGGDIASETVLKTYTSIRRHGMRNLDNENIEQRHRQFRNYFFISAKLNNITKKQDEAKRRGIFQSDNDGVDMVDTESSDAKVRKDLLKDYMVMRIIDIVEDNFDDISFRCYRLYSLLEGMTYAKLKQLTGITNCKQRVVDVKKWLRENVDEGELRKDFEREYDINIII